MACLNFLYACLESQVRRSLHAIGADLSCGILHADKPDHPRDNLVLDAIEPLRAQVDNLFLAFLGMQVFSLGDFQLRSDGSVALHPALCRVLVESCRVEQRKVDDEVRLLRAVLLSGDYRAQRSQDT
jgi:CRISPR/Cas system-associated endonuclease Cas1